jgi:flagellin-specific chaperone FliS
MGMNESFLLYRGASTDGATHLDLIIAVYDGLARDLGRIADAIAASDIEGRCKWSHHALLLLGYLETWVERLHEPELERSLNAFYAYLRAELLRLQANQDESAPRKLAMMVCETRAIWQQKATPASVAPARSQVAPALHNDLAPDDKPRLAWSA